MSDPAPSAAGPACAVPLDPGDRVVLGHGSGGRLSAALLRHHFLPAFDNATLRRLGDGAVLDAPGRRLVVTTDSFVVSPLEFPGGDIGALAVNGTLNDLAMMGAEPRWLTAGFVLEEGLAFALLDRIVCSMAAAARAAGVEIVAGDTKVVERGSADGLFVNTTGLGLVHPDFQPNPARARAGDVVLVSGEIGRHGMAVMGARADLGLETTITSDTAALPPLVTALRAAVGDAVHVLRDPTRGGVASALNELAQAAGVGVTLRESSLPIPGPVDAACAVLGLDPLYVANEGILLAFVAPGAADRALAALQAHPLGMRAARIGQVVDRHPGLVVLETEVGGTRVVDLLSGDQLPRIC
jgi:hydrogenase expression/formation protein HypE